MQQQARLQQQARQEMDRQRVNMLAAQQRQAQKRQEQARAQVLAQQQAMMMGQGLPVGRSFPIGQVHSQGLAVRTAQPLLSSVMPPPVAQAVPMAPVMQQQPPGLVTNMATPVVQPLGQASAFATNFPPPRY